MSSRWLWLLCAALLCAACAPHSTTQAPVGEEVPDEPVLIAEGAWRDASGYYLKYRRGDEEFYAAGALSGRHLQPPDAHTGYEVARVEALAPRPPRNWPQLREELTPVPILGIDAWARFRDSIFAGVVPRGGNSGVVVSFERGDYFFFYDRQGRFRARLLIDKPPWYRVAGRIQLADYYDRWEPALQAFLRAEGLDTEDVLFNTGDLEAGAIPFIYINTREKMIMLMLYEEVPAELAGELPASHWLQSLWHFVGSHTYSIPLRPFSSAQGLLSLVADTALQSGTAMINALPPPSAAPPLADAVPMDLQAWEEELDRRLQRPASSGRVDFLVDGASFFPRFIDAVTSARSSVDIRAYIFDNDDVALTVAELLKRRSREGIETRVLFDGLGTITAGAEHPASLPEHHHAPVSMHRFLEEDSRVDVRSVKNTWLAGDHVKTMVVDRRLAFLGGMNIGREYRYDWHDLMVQVTGPVVDEINRDFEAAWAQAGWLGDFGMMFHHPPKAVNADAGGYPLRLVYTRPGQQEIFNLQREAIRRARRYIYIENAYFTDDELLRELIDARQRGVDVRVIIPLETDRGLITRNIALAANQMMARGITVYIYPGFTHAKAAVFDGWACVGSANLDRLSLKINREINLATSHPEAVQELLDELFLPDFAASPQLTRPLPREWSDGLIELLGDYIF